MRSEGRFELFALHGRAGFQFEHFSLFLKELRLRPTLGARRWQQPPEDCLEAVALSKDCGEGRVLTIWAGDKNDSRVQPISEKNRIDAATRTSLEDKSMTRQILRLAAIAFVACTFSVSAQAETLRIGMECTYAPFNYRTAEGELSGYDVDVAKGVAGILGADIEFVCQKWDGMIPALLANKFDLIVASMSITEKRKEKIDFSGPYRISVGRLVGRKQGNFNLFNGDGSVNPASFKGVKVGLERATTYENWFKAKVPNAEILYYDSNEAMYLDLMNGRTDVIMTNPMKAHLKFLSKEDGAGFEFVSPAIDEVEYFGVGVGIGIRKGNEELLKRINAALIQLRDDGSLERYALKIFPFPIHPEKWTALN